MDKQLNETFPGIESVNDFYTPFYMQEFFPSSVRAVATMWNNLPAGERPLARLRAQQHTFAQIMSGNAGLELDALTVDFIDGILNALGYDERKHSEPLTDSQTGQPIPIRLEIDDEKGQPELWILTSVSTDDDLDIMSSPIGDSELTAENCVRSLFTDFERPARWIMVLGLHQAVLIDRRKWAEKRCLIFDFDTIFSRHQSHVYQAVAVLLSRASLCPKEGGSNLDIFDDESNRQSVAVSDSLRSALRECVELLGNEVIHDWVENKHRDITDLNADNLTVQCLRYMYRLLFLLFIEAKPELGYAPMKAEAYRTAYSLESLRDIAERMRGREDEADSTTYLADTLRRLDLLVFDGYPEDDAAFKRLTETKDTNFAFTVPALKAHIFDPQRTEIIEDATLRDSVMLRIVDLMSVTNNGQQKRQGRRHRKQRISYSALGISQMGAVYEALLSYRGFIAKEKLYEVKRAKDKFDPLNVGYFVGESQLGQYDADERVRYMSGPHQGELRTYEPGTFIYRMAGRERETSASFYTPDNLAATLVKYALKEIEPRIHKATDILELKICEPAMGSATFLNETINQLSEWYLTLRERERVAAEGQSAVIPAEHRRAELQRVKMFIADRNIYGIDLNPIAVELGEVSLWLNTICDGSFVPWFGTQLVCGNSLIGARRSGYLDSELREKAPNRRWYNKQPKRIGFNGQSSSSTKRVYQFLTVDPGMCAYDNSVVKRMEPENIAIIKQWQKKAGKPYTDQQIESMRKLSKTADELWRGQIKNRRNLEKETTDALSVYGYDDVHISAEERRIGSGQSAFDNLYTGERKVNLTIRQKDEMLTDSYRSIEATNASEYARLKLAMDYWCSLWFWPIDQADKLPTRSEYLHDLWLILTGGAEDGGFELLYENGQPTFDEADAEGDPRDYMRDHKVNLGELRESDDSISERLRIVDKIAEEQHFFHWELEFADVFQDGGFDFMIGNPPWVNVHWSETDAIADANPIFAVHATSAADMNKQLPSLLQDAQTRKTLLREYVNIAGALSFYGSESTYPLLKGQRTNLFRCFLPNAWDYTKPEIGISAFVHPDEVYGDTRAGILHKQMYRRLKYHFQFTNRNQLFSGIDSKISFSLNVYRNFKEQEKISFDSIWNLDTPESIDKYYDSKQRMFGTNEKYNSAINEDLENRIIHIDEDALIAFSKLAGDNTGDGWKSTQMFGVYSASLLPVLKRMAMVPKTLRDYADVVTYSSMWNETISRKDRTIQNDIHFPDSTKALIYSSPFIGVANPIMQSTRRNYRSNSDYDFVDITDINDDYLLRTKYSQACTDIQYQERIQKMKDGSRFDSVYRICNREYVQPTNERTLFASCVHPGVAWVNTIAGYGVHPERYALLALMSGLEASIPYDFLVRTFGKPHINRSSLESFPVPESCLSGEIRLRGLLLNCLTKPYTDLWRSCWNKSYTSMSWAKKDTRLDPKTFTNLSREWSWNTPLRTDYERRQALVELDVLSAMALGLTLDELIDIYKLTFTVLKGYEDDTWYDANGRIAFSSKNYGNLTYERKDFDAIKNAKEGRVFRRTISDDTQPGGPCERIIEYDAPFDVCDRVEDYRTAWRFFESKYGQQLPDSRTMAEVKGE